MCALRDLKFRLVKTGEEWRRVDIITFFVTAWIPLITLKRTRYTVRRLSARTHYSKLALQSYPRLPRARGGLLVKDCEKVFLPLRRRLAREIDWSFVGA